MRSHIHLEVFFLLFLTFYIFYFIFLHFGKMRLYLLLLPVKMEILLIDAEQWFSQCRFICNSKVNEDSF